MDREKGDAPAPYGASSSSRAYRTESMSHSHVQSTAMKSQLVVTK